MNKNTFIEKILEIGAGVELSASKIESEKWLKDANDLYDLHFKEINQVNDAKTEKRAECTLHCVRNMCEQLPKCKLSNETYCNAPKNEPYCYLTCEHYT